MNQKSKIVINRNANEIAKDLGLSPLDAIEWEIRYLITQQIIVNYEKNNLSVTNIAKISGTSRARITKILKNETIGISLDVLIRVLGSLGEKIKISFKKAA